MNLLPLLLVLCLLIKNNKAVKWESLENMIETLNGYQKSAEISLMSVENLVDNTTTDATSFLSSLDELAILKEVNSLPEGDKCKEQFADVKTSKNAFKMQFSQLEGPLVKRISDIKIRFNDLRASLLVHQGLAESKWWACKLEGKECTEETKRWVDERIGTLACKVVKDCFAKNVVKRETALHCNRRQYEYSGSCYDIEHYTCDDYCNNGRHNCFDEPSSGCTKHCVGGFHCNNLQCIDRNQVCNGINDCGDNSDEDDCVKVSPNNCTLEMGKFLCSDRSKCVDLASSCDGHSDCDDGSDEGEGCWSSDCGEHCSSAGGVCLRTPRGKICLSHCPPGTSETPDGCKSGPTLPPETLAELLDDLPRLTSRYLAGYKLLQSRLVDELAASLARVADCRGGSLGSVLRLSGFLNIPRIQVAGLKRTKNAVPLTATDQTTSYVTTIHLQPEETTTIGESGEYL